MIGWLSNAPRMTCERRGSATPRRLGESG